MTRIAIDMPAPDFRLMDYQGQEFHLGAYRGKKNILLVFNRGFR